MRLQPRVRVSPSRPSAAALKRKLLCTSFAATTLLTPALPLHAQGCTQCLDSTRATPPQVQAAFRHAIYLLGGAATALFVTGTLFLRNRR